jgi:phosphoribosylanthranilate isomerase
MTWVKICGITNLEDALTAVDAGADALGFVFYEKSSRNVAPETAREIVSKLPKDVEKVGVFVNQSVQHVLETVQQVRLTTTQLYGAESVAGFAGYLETHSEASGVCPKLIAVVPGHKLSDGGIFVSATLKKVLYGLLIDSGSARQPGGTGKPFDWEKARGMVLGLGAKMGVRVIVAGGLTSNNLLDAMRLFHPWGVDVASGVEARPGKKDPDKVRAFVAAVRHAEKSL